ncbi:MAG: response regulator transcription factor [Egibacteraceae bacterium]
MGLLDDAQHTATRPEPWQRAPASAPGAPGAPPPCVLVADAQLLFADALALALGRAPALRLDPHLPTTGLEALRVIGAARPDIALVDYALPGMHGPALAASLGVHAPATKVVHLAWFCGPADVERSLAAGAAGFLCKRLRVGAVVDAIVRVHAGQRPVLTGRSATLPHTSPPRPGASRSSATEQLATLTPRQAQTLHLVATGLTASEISDQLGITEGTVRSHIHHLLARLGARTQHEAVDLAREAGMAP